MNRRALSFLGYPRGYDKVSGRVVIDIFPRADTMKVGGVLVE